jgi:dCMP deaminase
MLPDNFFSSPSTQASWEEIWFEVARTIAKRSRCDRAQIGAVIVNDDNRIISTGYNGAAAGYPTKGGCKDWCDRAKGITGLSGAYDGCPSIHAEANALLYVDRSAIHGGKMYVIAPPCMGCAKLISNSGISQVFCLIGPEDGHRNPEVAIDYLEKCGIKVTTIPR